MLLWKPNGWGDEAGKNVRVFERIQITWQTMWVRWFHACRASTTIKDFVDLVSLFRIIYRRVNLNCKVRWLSQTFQLIVRRNLNQNWLITIIEISSYVFTTALFSRGFFPSFKRKSCETNETCGCLNSSFIYTKIMFSCNVYELLRVPVAWTSQHNGTVYKWKSHFSQANYFLQQTPHFASDIWHLPDFQRRSLA